MSTSKRNLLFALAAAVAVAGVLIATLTGGGGGGHRRSTSAGGAQTVSGANGLGLAAGYLQISPARLRDELRAGRSLEAIADATPGKSAAGLLHALVAARSAQLRARPGIAKLGAAARARRVARLRRRLERQLRRLPGYIALGVDARYLGISTGELRAQLSAGGRSLAQIADATAGKSAQGLIQARVSAREASIEATVKASGIDRARLATAIATLRRHITEEVERVPRR